MCLYDFMCMLEGDLLLCAERMLLLCMTMRGCHVILIYAYAYAYTYIYISKYILWEERMLRLWITIRGYMVGECVCVCVFVYVCVSVWVGGTHTHTTCL
jgi:hypothetical protein